MSTHKRDVRDDDLTRTRQYKGLDESGHAHAPKWHDTDGVEPEAVPGNRGEAGGRWHDHEGRAGFTDRATGLYPDPATGRAAYGPRGREGFDASVVKRGDTQDAQGAQGAQGGSAAEGTRPATPPGLGDARIRDEVRARIEAAEGVDAQAIEVSVKDAEVTLEGVVPTRAAKRLAEDIAAGVEGVRDVMNQLRVAH